MKYTLGALRRLLAAHADLPDDTPLVERARDHRFVLSGVEVATLQTTDGRTFFEEDPSVLDDDDPDQEVPRRVKVVVLGLG